jgi:Family of unknown function (DUF5372)
MQGPMGAVPVVEQLELAQCVHQVGLIPDQGPVEHSRRQVCIHLSMIELDPSSTTPHPDDPGDPHSGDGRYRWVRVTHPFHPLVGREFEFVEARQNWGEDRVVLHDEHGAVFSLPTGWTDAGAVDPWSSRRAAVRSRWRT